MNEYLVFDFIDDIDFQEDDSFYYEEDPRANEDSSKNEIYPSKKCDCPTCHYSHLNCSPEEEAWWDSLYDLCDDTFGDVYDSETRQFLFTRVLIPEGWISR